MYAIHPEDMYIIVFAGLPAIMHGYVEIQCFTGLLTTYITILLHSISGEIPSKAS
jgi:hypothetical protein